MQELIRNKAVSGGKANKGAMQETAKGKSNSKSKGKKNGNGRKSKPLQIEPTGPANVEICSFDSANLSGKYHLHLVVPVAALVCPQPSSTASYNRRAYCFITIWSANCHSLCHHSLC
jgi:hypothetical protein